MESCRPLMNKTRGRSRAHQAACVRLVSPRGARVLPQVPRHLPRHLRRPRKSRGICRGVRAGRASLEVFAEAFAQVAQVPRHLPRRLRRPRKSHGICRDVCASRAGSRGICRDVCAGRAGSRGICRDVCAGRASSKIFVGACLFVDNGRPAYGSPRANRLMACSMSPPRRSAKRMTSTFSVSSVVYARYSSRETSVA